MKKKLNITGIYNDELTNYENKLDNTFLIVDTEKDCTCGKTRCLIHEMPANYKLSNIK